MGRESLVLPQKLAGQTGFRLNSSAIYLCAFWPRYSGVQYFGRRICRLSALARLCDFGLGWVDEIGSEKKCG